MTYSAQSKDCLATKASTAGHRVLQESPEHRSASSPFKFQAAFSFPLCLISKPKGKKWNICLTAWVPQYIESPSQHSNIFRWSNLKTLPEAINTAWVCKCFLPVPVCCVSCTNVVFSWDSLSQSHGSDQEKALMKWFVFALWSQDILLTRSEFNSVLRKDAPTLDAWVPFFCPFLDKV